MSKFTENLIKLKGNKTIKEYAEELKISERALKYYLSEEREPRMELLKNIAEKHNISIDYLVGRSDDDSPFRKE